MPPMSLLPYKLYQSVPERFRDWKLEDMQPTPQQVTATEYCDNYTSNIPAGRGLIIIGPTGTGKTSLAIAVLNGIASRVRGQKHRLTYNSFAKFITAHDLFDLARDFDNPAHIQHRNIKLLIIDDIGATRLTNYAQSELAALLDHRYASYLPTIVTTNLSVADFTTYLGERTLSRLRECCRIIQLTGPDRRASK